MLSNASLSETKASALSDGYTPTQRRIRHISAIQIVNLTPFPVRDAVTSALSQPAEQAQYITTGQATDDIAAILVKKRTRKISTNSNATHLSSKRDDTLYEENTRGLGEGRGRRLSASRMNYSAIEGGEAYSNHFQIARTLRGRKNSMTTSSNPQIASTSYPFPAAMKRASSATLNSPPLLPDNSQAGLEHVMKYRLVETFISITTPAHSFAAHPRPGSSPRPSHTISMDESPSTEAAAARNFGKQNKNRVANGTLKSSLKSYSPTSSSLRSPAKQSKGTQKAATGSLNTRKGSSPSFEKDDSVQQRFEPEYLSSVHRRSINPLFPIDAHSKQFSKLIDTSGHKLQVEIWGKSTWSEDIKRGKLRRYLQDGQNCVWKSLDCWNIDLNDLVPLSDLSAIASQLQSNSLLVYLEPPGRLFYLPAQADISSRSSSPSTGYISDPESELRKAKQSGGFFATSLPDEGSADQIIPFLSHRRRRHKANESFASADTLKTSDWQKLFELVTLQSCIVDNESSLDDIIHRVDQVLLEDVAAIICREISERQKHLEEIRQIYFQVKEESDFKRNEIAVRKQQLQERTEKLLIAKGGIFADQEALKNNILKEREHLNNLKRSTIPCRSLLLSTLSDIFPIEIYSPPDLLFTILGVPLPIPLASQDPAPPLSLSNHGCVNEESIATSLGYAAQLLQILAAYLGKGLIYPVTCIGSRSLIKDGISAMVGPRMFPLFSKGVDTYRFEYGVFLLNKDIEMLMVDRDLRALDMRHTLPNLKNLLLTLSHDHNALSPLASILADSPSSTGEEYTPKISPSTELPKDRTTPPASGSTTPTVPVIEETSKSRSFLGFAPLTEFLRSRYPSTSRHSSKLSSESSTEPKATASEEQDEDEDARTIHGFVREPVGYADDVEHKPATG